MGREWRGSALLWVVEANVIIERFLSALGAYYSIWKGHIKI